MNSKCLNRLLLSILFILLSSCAVISKDKIIYLGHPKELRDYQIYYDKTVGVYLFLDRHGCFYKSENDSGTCMAFNQKEAEALKEKILPKMLETEEMILKEENRERLIELLKNTNRKTIKRPVKLDIKVRPVKQININHEKEYHIVPNKYKVAANLIIMLDSIGGEDNIKVLYTFRIPYIMKKRKTSTKPYIIDPDYLKEVLNMNFVKKVEEMRDKQRKLREENEEDLSDYLSDELHI